MCEHGDEHALEEAVLADDDALDLVEDAFHQGGGVSVVDAHRGLAAAGGGGGGAQAGFGTAWADYCAKAAVPRTLRPRGGGGGGGGSAAAVA